MKLFIAACLLAVSLAQTGCLDVTGRYVYQYSDGSTHVNALSQVDCEGAASDGWLFWVEYSSLKIRNEIGPDTVGSIMLNGDIIFDNGYVYMKIAEPPLNEDIHFGLMGQNSCSEETQDVREETKCEVIANNLIDEGLVYAFNTHHVYNSTTNDACYLQNSIIFFGNGYDETSHWICCTVCAPSVTPFNSPIQFPTNINISIPTSNSTILHPAIVPTPNSTHSSINIQDHLPMHTHNSSSIRIRTLSENGCVDMTGKYMYDHADGSIRVNVLVQIGCDGSSSDGWRFAVDAFTLSIPKSNGRDVIASILLNGDLVFDSGIYYTLIDEPDFNDTIPIVLGDLGSLLCPSETGNITSNEECAGFAETFIKKGYSTAFISLNRTEHDVCYLKDDIVHLDAFFSNVSRLMCHPFAPPSQAPSFHPSSQYPTNMPTTAPYHACIDVSGQYQYENRGGSIDMNILTQNGCIGLASDGWKFQIYQRSLNIIDGSVSGTVMPNGNIIFDNGILYIRVVDQEISPTAAAISSISSMPSYGEMSTMPTAAELSSSPSFAKPSSVPSTAELSSSPSFAKPSSVPSTAVISSRPSVAKPSSIPSLLPKELKVVASVSGVTTENKDLVCDMFAATVGGSITYCSFSSSFIRRSEGTNLYMNIAVDDPSVAQSILEDSEFISSISLPIGVYSNGISVIDEVPSIPTPSPVFGKSNDMKFCHDVPFHGDCYAPNCTNSFNEYELTQAEACCDCISGGHILIYNLEDSAYQLANDWELQREFAWALYVPEQSSKSPTSNLFLLEINFQNVATLDISGYRPFLWIEPSNRVSVSFDPMSSQVISGEIVNTQDYSLCLSLRPLDKMYTFQLEIYINNNIYINQEVSFNGTVRYDIAGWRMNTAVQPPYTFSYHFWRPEEVARFYGDHLEVSVAKLQSDSKLNSRQGGFLGILAVLGFSFCFAVYFLSYISKRRDMALSYGTDRQLTVKTQESEDSVFAKSTAIQMSI